MIPLTLEQMLNEFYKPRQEWIDRVDKEMLKHLLANTNEPDFLKRFGTTRWKDSVDGNSVN